MNTQFDFFTGRGWKLCGDKEDSFYTSITVLSVPDSCYQDMADFKAINPAFQLAYETGQWVLLLVKGHW